MMIYILSSFINLFAQDITSDGSYLSDKYIKGAFLIYDCQDSHYVCTSSLESKRCESIRYSHLKDNKDTLGCTPLKQYSSVEQCHKFQQLLTDQSRPARHCLHPLQMKKVYLYQ